MSLNFSKFGADTLRNIANLSVRVPELSFNSYNRINPQKVANEYDRPVMTRESLDGIVELQHYHLIVGIEANSMHIPYEIRNLTHRPITVNTNPLIFKTPIFGRSLAQTPVNVIPGRNSGLLVVTLPDSLIEECGEWWNLVNSEEEFEIIPDVLKIRYNSVNVLNTILNKRY